MGALPERADVDAAMLRIDREATRLTELTEDRLRQVVANLVGNAVAHTPPGSPVRIGVGTLDGRAVLDVVDEGPGMTAEQAGRVFDRFYRANRSRERSSGASAGLGLSIARSLARAHGGDVELRTRLGEGARFRLTLPLLDRARREDD
nr:sensor histidine kinase [Jiangella rhizosphaerae]